MSSGIFPIYPSVVITPAKLREIETKRSHKIVFTYGRFDILNSAHLRLINSCRKFGDILVVALQSDDSIRRVKGEPQPINCIKERMECLREIGLVDYVYMFDGDEPTEILRDLRPDVLVRGGDGDGDGGECDVYAARVEIFKHVPGISTSDVIKRARLRE